jgi:Na+(H+)/acetate symporter ActP
MDYSIPPDPDNPPPWSWTQALAALLLVAALSAAALMLERAGYWPASLLDASDRQQHEQDQETARREAARKALGQSNGSEAQR